MEDICDMTKEKDKYSIENLIVTFADHSKIYDQHHKKALEDYPDSEHLKDDFNISSALYHICLEVDRLKILASKVSR